MKDGFYCPHIDVSEEGFCHVIRHLRRKLAEAEQKNKELTEKFLKDNFMPTLPPQEIVDKLEADLTECRERLARYDKKPKTICLCGSTRFTAEMLIIQWEFTKQGFIVLSWCALPDNYFKGEDKTHVGDQEGVKEIVDEVHKRKIDISDEVFVVNIDGYIGESTASEIAYAHEIGCPVVYLEALKEPE